ncbi:molecular chaperone [uncultured Ramlibacter sp.]|uniref:fimbrial biogenesis chaperone n=1 Tax=uncultured Ramlibacter sp. TaxID=260755 RepID=UPI00260A9BB9|nr:fimbria/pilus periplasmic chaperone [uncultured Ramlibacter sp.]
MNHSLRALALLLPLCGLGLPAGAADFSITPVRIFMEPRDRAVAITVTNDGEQEIVMQADLFVWKQKPDGEFDLVPTEDLILSPPILKLAPKSRQVVRLARLGPPPAGSQLTYRMIVREIPEARPASTDNTLQIALAFSLPIFITPPTAKRDLSCSATRASANAVMATCKNSGTAFAQVREFVLLASNGERIATRDTGGYILPEITRSFEIKREGAAIPSGAMKLQVALDDGTMQAVDLALTD